MCARSTHNWPVPATRTADLADLLAHLERTTPLSLAQRERLVDEVVAYFSETVDEMVRRRHRELQREGLANEDDLRPHRRGGRRRGGSARPQLSARQLRRIVYG